MSRRTHAVSPLVAAWAAGACSLAMLAPAQSAVVYQGSWDPAFGAAFPTMGWRASAKLFIPTACEVSLAGFTGTITNFSAYGGCVSDLSGLGGIRLGELALGLYALPDDPTTEFYSGVDYVVNNDGDCYGGDVFNACIDEISFVDGEVTGFATAFSDALNLDLSDGGFDSTLLECDDDPVSSSSFDFKLKLGLGADSILRAEYLGGECAGDTIFTSENQPDLVTFVRLPSQVPEPGTILLTLSALALGLRLSRRR